MGGKTSTTSSQVQIPPDVLARYNSVNATAQNVAQTPFQQYSTNPNAFVAPITPTQSAGIANTNAAAGMAQPYFNAATGFALAGAQPVNASPLNTSAYMNPYLSTVLGSTEAMVNQQNQQAMAGQTANAINQGYFGGDRSGIAAAVLQGQQELAGGQLYSGIASDAYTNALAAAQQQQGVQLGAEQANRAALQGTSSALAGLGTGAQGAALTGAQAQLGAGQVEQQTEQAGLTALYNQFLQQQSYPFQTAQFLANIAEGTGALSGSTTTTTQPGGLFSDERLKEDMEPIGKGFDGANIYRFRYKGDPTTRIGMSAQEVERKHPEAVRDVGGFKAVDYGQATEDAAQRGGFALAANDNEERRARQAGGGMSEWGSYPAGVNPMVIAQLLQAQAQMYGPGFGGAGLYGQQSGGAPHGGSSYVPQANLPVPMMQIARPPAQPSTSALDQMAKMADLGSKVSDFSQTKAGQAIGHGIHQAVDYGKDKLGMGPPPTLNITPAPGSEAAASDAAAQAVGDASVAPPAPPVDSSAGAVPLTLDASGNVVPVPGEAHGGFVRAARQTGGWLSNVEAALAAQRQRVAQQEALNAARTRALSQDPLHLRGTPTVPPPAFSRAPWATPPPLLFPPHPSGMSPVQASPAHITGAAPATPTPLPAPVDPSSAIARHVQLAHAHAQAAQDLAAPTATPAGWTSPNLSGAVGLPTNTGAPVIPMNIGDTSNLATGSSSAPANLQAYHPNLFQRFGDELGDVGRWLTEPSQSRAISQDVAAAQTREQPDLVLDTGREQALREAPDTSDFAARGGSIGGFARAHRQEGGTSINPYGTAGLDIPTQTGPAPQLKTPGIPGQGQTGLQNLTDIANIGADAAKIASVLARGGRAGFADGGDPGDDPYPSAGPGLDIPTAPERNPQLAVAAPPKQNSSDSTMGDIMDIAKIAAMFASAARGGRIRRADGGDTGDDDGVLGAIAQNPVLGVPAMAVGHAAEDLWNLGKYAVGTEAGAVPVILGQHPAAAPKPAPTPAAPKSAPPPLPVDDQGQPLSDVGRNEAAALGAPSMGPAAAPTPPPRPPTPPPAGAGAAPPTGAPPQYRPTPRHRLGGAYNPAPTPPAAAPAATPPPVAAPGFANAATNQPDGGLGATGTTVGAYTPPTSIDDTSTAAAPVITPSAAAPTPSPAAAAAAPAVGAAPPTHPGGGGLGGILGGIEHAVGGFGKAAASLAGYDPQTGQWNRDILFPLISTVAGTLAAPTKYPAVALTQGLLAGSNRYMGMQQQEAELSQAQIQNLEYANSLIPPEYRETFRAVPGADPTGKNTVTIPGTHQQYHYEPAWNLWQSLGGGQQQPTGASGGAGGPAAATPTGAAPPPAAGGAPVGQAATGAVVAAQRGDGFVPHYDPGGGGTLAIGHGDRGAAYMTQNFSDHTGTGMPPISASNPQRMNQDLIKRSEGATYDEQEAQARAENNAQEGNPEVNSYMRDAVGELAQAVAAGPESGLLATGPGASKTTDVATFANRLIKMFGLPPNDAITQAGDNKQIIDKLSAYLGDQAAKMGNTNPAAVEIARLSEVLPSLETNKGAAMKVLSQMMVRTEKQLDFQQYRQDHVHTWGTEQGAVLAWRQDTADRYQREEQQLPRLWSRQKRADGSYGPSVMEQYRAHPDWRQGLEQGPADAQGRRSGGAGTGILRYAGGPY